MKTIFYSTLILCIAGVFIFAFLTYKKSTTENDAVSTEAVGTENASSTGVSQTPQEPAFPEAVNKVEVSPTKQVVPQATSTVVTPVQNTVVATKPASESALPTIDVQTFLPCQSLLMMQDIDPNKKTLTADAEKEMLEKLKDTSIVSATEVCQADKVVTSPDLKQRFLSIYIKNINEAYSIDIHALAPLDRKSKVLQYEKDVAVKRSQKAIVYSKLTSLRTEVQWCTGVNNTFSTPKEGEKLCASSLMVWPDLKRYEASWGGCETTLDSENYIFQFCAILPDSTVVICTQDRCAPKE